MKVNSITTHSLHKRNLLLFSYLTISITHRIFRSTLLQTSTRIFFVTRRHAHINKYSNHSTKPLTSDIQLPVNNTTHPSPNPLSFFSSRIPLHPPSTLSPLRRSDALKPQTPSLSFFFLFPYLFYPHAKLQSPSINRKMT